MWIVRLALRRPYTFVVAAFVLLLLTPYLLLKTPTDIFPSINIPVVSVIWQYKGLNPQELEQRVLYVHERSLTATVNDIEHVESNSYNGVGIIKVFFQPGSNVDAGVAQLTAVAQTVLRQMPPGQTPPLIIRYNASTVPILQYSLTSKTLSEQAVADLALNQVRLGVATIQGAQIPWPYGGRERAVVVDLDLTALKSRNLRPQDIVDAVNVQNLILPSGTAKLGDTEYNIEVNSSPKVLDDLNDLPIKQVNGATIYLRDVAQVRDGFNPQTNVVRMDGQRGALITVMKSGMASTLDVVEKVKAKMPVVEASVSEPGLEIKPFADQSIFVRAAISGVAHEGLIAAALTAIMILLFIGSWRSTVIIAISIPLSVLVSLAALSALGETINLMTLGGLSLAVGILVDDATVEIENVHRQMALGKPLIRAILDGAQEIALPALVSTFCICIVFVPMFFLTGVAKFLFVPLAEAVIFAMLASYLISRTLVPTLVMYFYRNHPLPAHGDEAAYDTTWPKGWTAPFVMAQRAFERGFIRFRHGYEALLGVFLRHKKVFGAVFLFFCLGSLAIVPQLGQDFFPKVDGGQFRLHLRARTGSRIEETTRLVERVDQVIREMVPKKDLGVIVDNIGIPFSGIALSYSNNGVIGTGDADMLVTLNEGHAPTDGYVRELRARLNREFPSTMFYFLPADIVSQTLNLGLPAPFDVQIFGRDLVSNRALAAKLADKIRRVPGAVDVRVQQPADSPKLTVNADRDRAGQVGLNERDVANSVLLSLSGSGQVQPAYWLNPKLGIQYVVNIRAPEHVMDSMGALEAIPVSGGRGGEGDGQLLTNVSTIQRGQNPPVFSHYDVAPVINVFGNVSGRDLGGVIGEITPLLDEARKSLPKGTTIEMRGQAATMKTSYWGLGIGLVLAIILIYLLLVINFQSWLDPAIIISALPGALAGVTWSLWVTQTTLSVPALMGAIMSLGVATANSVLIVSFARNRLREVHDQAVRDEHVSDAGGATSDPEHEAAQAAMMAGTTRLRAVLMTALAMIAGMLPMSFGLGEGGEQNAPVGRAVIGGLLIATVATLFFVPVVFAFFHRRTGPAAPLDPELLEPGEVPQLEASAPQPALAIHS